MCGIAGHFSIHSRERRSDAETVAASQIAVIRHRGPDAAGVWTGPGIALAHARLSIIDTSAAANQPMSDASGSVTIVFNGEIYNFGELRNELTSLGHRFRTRSDTEAIIEGYKAWGDDVVLKLRGMFAFALYDARRDRLLLARDRVGKKPLYYATISTDLVFASEIKGVLAYPGSGRQPDLAAIHEYLTFQYVPSPMTAFQGVAKLPPAHVAVVERGREPRISRYWSLPAPSLGAPQRPVAELTEELVAELREATRLRLIADVPLGAFLSGGVDSSAVVAAMAAVSKEPVRTFTIGFEDQAFDERAYARDVARRYGTRHEELVVAPDGREVIEALVWHYGEPFADSSAIPTWYVSKIAREHVTVILSGDGGDESFLGYRRYLACRVHDTASHIPSSVRRGIQGLASVVPKQLDRNKMFRQLRGMGATVAEPLWRRYEQFVAYVPDAMKAQLYAGDLQRYLAMPAMKRLAPYFDECSSMVAGAAHADVHTYLPDDLLVKTDVASMAHALEVRAPFLDHKLMEWAARIPVSQRFTGMEPKSLLKKAMEPFLPRDLLYRPKMGFAVPLDAWLRGPMREMVADTLLDNTATQRGLFHKAAVGRLIARHNAGESLGPRIWALLMLELWFRMWIDGPDPCALRFRESTGRVRADSMSLSA